MVFLKPISEVFMVQVGAVNDLKVSRKVEAGVYLDGFERGEILLPATDFSGDLILGSSISVFLYFGSKGILTATTREPLTQVHACARLSVVDVNSTGAFLNWGLAKDLLVPFGEQQTKMVAGKSYVVYTYHDTESDRIVASTKLHRHLKETNDAFQQGQEVALQIAMVTDLGYKAVADDRYLGMVFFADAYRKLLIGERLPGYVKNIRQDGKLDFLISRSSLKYSEDLGQRIILHLMASGGISELCDKSPPEAIYKEFKVSKKKYKQALGVLYRKRKVDLSGDKIRLLNWR